MTHKNSRSCEASSHWSLCSLIIKCAKMKRRDLLKFAGAGVASMPMLSKSARAHAFLNSKQWQTLLNPLSETDHVLVLIWLNGGNDGLNTVIPFEDAAYDVARPHIGFVSS